MPSPRRIIAPLVRAPRARLTSLLTRVWCRAFRRYARRAPSQARRWSTTGRERVLVLAPHPDDEVIGCGGTLLLHARAGDHVTLVFATDGRRSQALGLDAAAMAARREAEARRCAQLLGGEVQWLGLPEGEWLPSQLATQLAAELRRDAPTVLYAPSYVDFHPEHKRVAHALALALRAQPALGTALRVYPIQVPLTPVLANLVADVASVAEERARAAEAYETQAGNLARARRQRAYAGALHGLPGEAEEFWELGAERFVALHAAPDAALAAAFRGLRFDAFSDPLAYACGRRERRRLASS